MFQAIFCSSFVQNRIQLQITSPILSVEILLQYYSWLLKLLGLVSLRGMYVATAEKKTTMQDLSTDLEDIRSCNFKIWIESKNFSLF